MEKHENDIIGMENNSTGEIENEIKSELKNKISDLQFEYIIN